MSNLRHDLLTSGWSMMDCSKWLDLLNKEWNTYQRKAIDWLPWALQGWREEMEWLLHEALHDEWFYLENVETRTGEASPHWHIDGGYVRVLFAVRGEGTIVGRSFENNVPTPPGYALIMTGQQRMWKKGIPETWHTSPLLGYNRRLLLLNFRNAE